jgi:hypothetical protein
MEPVREEGEAEKEARIWFARRRKMRDLALKLRKEQEAHRAHEQKFPWLGSFKGTLRKKYGKNFDIPEGPKLAREAPPESEPVAGPSTETPLPKREEKKAPEKRKQGPLLLKAEGSRGQKEDPNPPQSGLLLLSKETPSPHGSVADSPVNAPGGTCGKG